MFVSCFMPHVESKIDAVTGLAIPGMPPLSNANYHGYLHKIQHWTRPGQGAAGAPPSGMASSFRQKPAHGPGPARRFPRYPVVP